MFNTVGTEDKASMFRSAMTVRCFLVGYRYFRQPAVHRARLMNVMLRNVAIVYAEHDAIVDFNIKNVRQSLERLAARIVPNGAASAELCASWTQDVLFMASPTMFKNADETDEQAYERWQSMMRGAVDSGFDDPELVRIAVSGNPTMSTMYNETGHSIAVYNEEYCIDANSEVPVLPDNLVTTWTSTLHYRRTAQCSR